MKSVQRNDDDKRTGRTGGKGKVSRTQGRPSRPPVDDNEGQLGKQHRSSSLATAAVLSDDEYRARVAQKAYELYQKRQALTEKDDWLEAERLIKLEILRGEDWTGSV